VHPPRLPRLALNALVLAAVPLLAAGPAHAELPVPGPLVEAVLAEVARAPRAPTAYGRFLAALPMTDSLAPAARAAWLERIRDLRGAPLLSARAELELLDHAPDGPEVHARAAALGFLTRWRVVGPDPATDVVTAQGDLVRALGEAGHADVGATIALGGQPRVWAEAGEGPPGGVSAEPWVLREAPTIVHLVTEVRCATSSMAVLRLGATGDVAVAVDGMEVGALRSLGPATPDQLEATLHLGRGLHRLTVSVAATGAARAVVFARFTDGRGRPLTGIAPATTFAPEAPTGPIRVVHPLHYNAALDPLRLRAGDSAEAALDAAVLRRALGLHDDGDADAEHALLEDILLDEAVAAMPVGARLLALGQVPREEARTSILLRWETLGRLGPAETLALAQLTGARGEIVRARGLVDAVAALPGVDPEALVVARARIDRLDGRPETAYTRLLDPGGRAREGATERVLVEAARGAQETGRPDVAARVMTRLSALLPGRVEHRAAAAQAGIDAGQVEAAVEGYASLAERRPDLPGYALEAARLAGVSGVDEARASALLARVRERARWSPDLLDACARQYEALGERDAAVSAFERSLELRPASPDVRGALERLRAAEPAPVPLVERLTPELVAAPPMDPDAVFEILADETVVEVRVDGSATRYVRRLVRVQHVPDDPAARTVAIGYDPSRELVSVLEARVHRGELAIPNLARRSRALGESWYGLYYDQRELDIPFDDLRDGDIVEVAWRVDAVGQLFPGVFSDLEVLQGRYPIHRTSVSVIAPAELGLRTHLEVPPTVPRDRFEATREQLADGRERFAVTGRAIPALVREPFMPGVAEVAPTWQVTTFASWAEVVAWYGRLLEAQRVMTPAMRAWVDGAVQRATGPTGLSRALLERGVADYVTSDVRYVGLEFGVHGYTPYRTDQVWTRRFGDCKDQATLLTTLLETAGGSARVALIRTRPHGRLPHPLPSVAAFDHAIVWLPESGRFVDPTASAYGLGELPAADQGAQVLVIDPETRDVRRSAVDRPDRNGLEGTYSISLRRDGGGNILGAVTFRGVQAPVYRELLLDPDARDQRLERALNGRYPGLSLTRADVSDPGDRSRPLDVSFSAEVSQLAQRVGDTLRIPRPAGGDGQAERLAGLPTRQHPLVVGVPSHTDVTFRYELPIGWGPQSVPRSAEREGRFGRWSVRWRQDVGAVEVRTELVLATDQVDPADYPDFRRFIQGFDAAVRPPLVLMEGAVAPEVGEAGR